MRHVVVVDDLRNFHPNHTNVIDKDTSITAFRNSPDALKWLNALTKDDTVDELWLDHDLGTELGYVDDIMPFVNLLEEKLYFGELGQAQIRKVLVHTSNSSGRERIYSALQKFLPVYKIDAAGHFVHEG